MEHTTKKLLLLSIFSRIFVLSFGKLASLIFQRFDKSTALSISKSPFIYLESWDTVHFINIARNGYAQEHTLPFFPLVPLIVRTLNFWDVLTTGVIFNNIIFICSTLVFHKVSLLYFPPDFSFVSTVFFIFNPASIIYSSFYTEGLFTLIFFLAFFNLTSGKHLKAAILLGISSFCRSNAVLFVMFTKVLYFPIVVAPFALFQLFSLLLIWKRTLSFRVFLPYSLIQEKYWNHGFLKFITIRNTPNILVGFPVIAISLFFLYQSWNMKRLNKLPNPKVSLVSSVIDDIENKKNKKLHAKEQLCSSSQKECSSHVSLEEFAFYNMRLTNYIYNDDTGNSMRKNEINTESQRHFIGKLTNICKGIVNYSLVNSKKDMLAMSEALLFLQTLMLIFLIHWNIAMRFLAYNPFLYWSATFFTYKYSKKTIFIAVSTFFAVYGLLYIVMFSCFYPPA